MTPEEYRTLFEYDTWANERICDACARISPEQFTRHLVSSFTSVRDTLVHIMGVQWVWLERLHERLSPKGLPDPQGFADLAAVRERWNEIRRELLAYVNGLSDPDIEHPFEYLNFRGDLFRDSPGPVLQHLVNHGAYHRGQITTLFRQLGAKPVGTDLIAFHRIRTGQ